MPVQRLIIGAIVIDAVGLGLNLFIGIIVSAMQEMAIPSEPKKKTRKK